ncbi:alpha-glucanase [Colletotrichum chrysophilum]|uniref:Alpha-glucanase n=1 Tax=Colletotrichum chrysophilum TaxID=1836956 RepID=A0AAD9AKK0_9PEZI|nr:alpha-glucanase [Colletotrichum chrysophilum]
MRFLFLVAGTFAWARLAQAQAVFAHFMITNSANYTADDWLDDIAKAKAAHIDAFALNMAYGDPTNEKSVANAFQHASSLGFQLFFSFDYAGNGPWPKSVVQGLINWVEIKAATGCFFIPDWSSLGAKPAMAKANGVADGLFSWAAWPWGDQSMDTYVDASYKQYLSGKPYMMAASPWFYTNLPGYDKNWMWRGDDLWFDRWQQILWWRPEFVQIISWNDYGESHHIGPVRDKSLEAFTIGKAPFNFVLPHDGWRDTLPFTIDMYKYNTTTVDSERLVAWYRPNPATSCKDGGTSGNTASQLQLEFHPWNVAKDAIYFTALLASSATIEVTAATPEGGVGLYHGNAWYYDQTGEVHIRVVRGGTVIAEVAGIAITTDCSKTNGYNNWNAWVGSATAAGSVSAKPHSRTDQVCVEGTGPLPGFATLCEFTCGYGYCPEGACHCTKLGAQVEKPKWKGITAYPAAGITSDYQGLCQNSCNWGFCPGSYCDTVEHPTVIATVSPFLPGTCTRGQGLSSSTHFDDLCSFACSHGFCPIAVCYCSAQGGLNLMEPTSKSNARTLDGTADDHGLCAFNCARGHCPSICADPDLGQATDLWQAGYFVPEYNIEEDDVYPSILSADTTCDPSVRPKTLNDLVKVMNDDTYNPVCRNIWALRILSDSLDSFQADYKDALSGYDAVFGYYADYVKQRISPQLESYMDFDTGRGNEFFTCSWTVRSRTREGPCPPADKFWQQSESWSVTYTLSDPDGFYAAVQQDLGIEKDWISFGDWHQTGECVDAPDWRPPGTKVHCREAQLYKKGLPVSSNNVKVSNPKDVIEAALPSISDLSMRVLNMYIMAGLGYADDTGDVVTAIAMPVLMLEGVIENMKEIKSIGAAQRDLEKKRLVLEILSIVLFVVPFAGEVVGAAFGGAAMVARIAAVIGEIGNTALTIESIVSDPASAHFAVLSLLIGPYGGASERTSSQAIAEAAAARRALSADKIKLFGEGFVVQDAKIQKIVNVCA